MNIVAAAIDAVERLNLPDPVTRAGIAALVGRSGRKLGTATAADERVFAANMNDFPIAQHVDAANAQHYEVPAAFFALCLGPRRKYSCCYYDTETSTLAEAEERALALTCAHAALQDGQAILELGCGWGSLTLYMAERYPRARITAVSNSHGQRHAIMAEAQARGIENVTVVTADMNDFDTPERHDRIVSVEMFEHIANWRLLLERTRRWLSDDGRVFIHVFAHEKAAYRFDHRDPADWIARHFFTGGIMPSRGLMHQFGGVYRVEESWNWNGRHYARTARDWLGNCDVNRAEIRQLFGRAYGRDAKLWLRRWRLFYLATEGLFAHNGGHSWGVSHYRLAPAG